MGCMTFGYDSVVSQVYLEALLKSIFPFVSNPSEGPSLMR